MTSRALVPLLPRQVLFRSATDPGATRLPVHAVGAAVTAPGLPLYLVREALRDQVKVSRYRDKLLQLHATLDHESQKLNHARDFARQSLESCVASLRATLDQTPEAYLTTATFEHFDRYKSDEADCRTQEAIVSDLQSGAGNLEYQIKNREKIATLSLRAVFLELGIDTADVELAQSPASESVPAHSTAPSLLQRYFERRGDIAIRFERLQELEDNHNEVSKRQDMFLDRGDELPLSDVEFLQTYENQHNFLLSEAKRAENDADLLYEACLTAGLDVGDAEDPFAELVESYEPAHAVEPMRTMSARDELVSSEPLIRQSPTLDQTIFGTGRSEPILQQFSPMALTGFPKANVRGWLQSVPDPHSASSTDLGEEEARQDC